MNRYTESGELRTKDWPVMNRISEGNEKRRGKSEGARSLVSCFDDSRKHALLRRVVTPMYVRVPYGASSAAPQQIDGLVMCPPA